MRRLRLRNRRGAVVIWFGLSLMFLMLVTALVYDFSYWWVVQTELQTSADAAALRGGLRLQHSGALADGLTAIEEDVFPEVVAFAAAYNPAQGKAVTLEEPETDTPPADRDMCLEWWTPPAAGVAPPTPDCMLTNIPTGATPNAVAVRAVQTGNTIFGRVRGHTSPQIGRMAVAWIAYINGGKCVKPWGFPQPALLTLATGTPTTSDRSLTSAEVVALSNMDDLERTMVIGPSQKLYDADDYPGTMHGNWAPIRFSSEYTTAANQGISEYMKLVAGKCLDGNFFSIGDAVNADFPGASVEKKTSEAMEGGACSGNCTSGGDDYPQVCYFKSAANADCYESATATAPGKIIRVAWTTIQTAMGAEDVTARTFGDFQLLCYVRKNANSCSAAMPPGYSSAISDYPEGTMIGIVLASFNERMKPEDVELGNTPSLSQILMLVK